MKSAVLPILVAVACSPVLAAEPTAAPPAAPAAASPAVAETPSTPAATEAKAVVPPLAVHPVVSAPSFCGQDEVYRLLMNTEIGKQLQLRQQEALRQAIAQAVAEGRIPAQQPQQPAVVNPQPAQPAPAESTTPKTDVPQR